MKNPSGGPPPGGPQNTQEGGPPSSVDFRRILILGGTGFIGISTTLALLDAGFEVCLANRGKVYWNKDLRQLPGVEHIKADREDVDAFAAAIEAAAKSQPWVGVVDFSAYKKRHLKAALKGLKKVGFGVYVHISTDSVYEVSDDSAWEGSPFVVEEHACRPTDEKKAYILNKKDSYAHHKMKCEEYLKQFADETKRPVVALRLADVIGFGICLEMFYQVVLGGENHGREKNREAGSPRVSISG
ncbi:hypothetical protein Emed_000107 [Eimeria media]